MFSDKDVKTNFKMWPVWETDNKEQTYQRIKSQAGQDNSGRKSILLYFDYKNVKGVVTSQSSHSYHHFITLSEEVPQSYYSDPKSYLYIPDNKTSINSNRCKLACVLLTSSVNRNLTKFTKCKKYSES